MTKKRRDIQLVADGKIGVLLGGVSRERDVSLNTGAAVAAALSQAGYTVTTFDWQPGPDQVATIANLDAVFLALHGGHGEGGAVQGLLNCLEVPFTGSGVTASAIAMDKVLSKRVFAQAGLSTPAFEALTGSQAALLLQSRQVDTTLDYPIVVKPAADGSSVGVSIAADKNELLAAIELAQNGSDCILLEAFVAGPELSIGVFDEQVMGTVAIVPADGFYNYEAKYQSNTTQYLIPPPISTPAKDAAEALAREAYDVLGCRGVARVDVMLDDSETPWLLEVNTLPGMTESSLVPKLAQASGESFPQLVSRMIEAAQTDTY